MTVMAATTTTTTATGSLVEVKVIRDKVTGYPSGYGFVEFESKEMAEKALDELNGHPIGESCASTTTTTTTITLTSDENCQGRHLAL